VLLALPVLASGCGEQTRPRARASGTVTLDGSNLKHRAVLTFLGPDRTPRSTETDEHGAFRIDDLPPGATTVTVSSVPEGGPATRPLGAPGQRSTAGTRLAPRTARTSGVSTEVPPEYGDATRPRLNYMILEGDNALDINLTTGPKPTPSGQPH
jgi:hypothetical protein